MSICLNNVSMTFQNNVTAVDHVNLEIPGGIFGLLGENGAGKTTLMRILTTVYRPTDGTVSLDGMLYSEGNYGKIQQRIGYLPQEIDLYPNLTVNECLEYMGELAGISRAVCRERISYYLEKTSLTAHRKKKMRQLSGGMKRRVGLIQALLNDPQFLIIDEPTTGLDPEERIRIRNLLVDFSENRTVLFSTHVVEDLAATCSRLAVMKKGRFLYSGGVRELLAEAAGHVWLCRTDDDVRARELERQYIVSSKQYVEGGVQMRLICPKKPDVACVPCEVTLEDAYIYISNKSVKRFSKRPKDAR
ncbi:MAG: ATP-binding cassette domain-containing protein [Lachnospiraceae bacterium]|nr:ATP-binding cassette domain-containing protein [Lachnospiraceae bacterium]